jgi:hypothetical protein
MFRFSTPFIHSGAQLFRSSARRNEMTVLSPFLTGLASD